jgi:hypothetical protein
MVSAAAALQRTHPRHGLGSMLERRHPDAHRSAGRHRACVVGLRPAATRSAHTTSSHRRAHHPRRSHGLLPRANKEHDTSRPLGDRLPDALPGNVVTKGTSNGLHACRSGCPVSRGRGFGHQIGCRRRGLPCRCLYRASPGLSPRSTDPTRSGISGRALYLAPVFQQGFRPAHFHDHLRR